MSPDELEAAVCALFTSRAVLLTRAALQVERDMQWQQAWVRIMRPCGSVLKFRLPWTDGCTTYVLQAAAPRRTPHFKCFCADT